MNSTNLANVWYLLFSPTASITYDVLSSCYNCLHEEVFEKEGAVVWSSDKLTFQHVLVRQWSMVWSDSARVLESDLKKKYGLAF